ncbi:MAG: transposase [bacterium]|nr:transposase [bacterium]
MGEEKEVILLFEYKRYNYQVIATNIEDMISEKVWRFYNGRANVENLIKEGIIGYGLDVTSSHCWGANTAHFFLVMLAYNLMKVKKMAKWVRQRFLFIAGRLVKRSRGWILRLSTDYPWQWEYWEAENRLKMLKFCT